MMQATHVLKDWVCIPPFIETTNSVTTRGRGWGFRLHGMLLKHPSLNSQNAPHIETQFWISSEVVGVDEVGYVVTNGEDGSSADAKRYACVGRFDWNWSDPAQVRLFNDIEKQYLTETVIPRLYESPKIVHSRLADALKHAIRRQPAPILTVSPILTPKPQESRPIPEVMLLFIVNNIHLIMFSVASCNQTSKTTGTKTAQSSNIQRRCTQK